MMKFARRGAARLGVVVGKQQAFGRETIEVRCLAGHDAPMIGPDIEPAHVIPHDEHDVGFLAGRGRLDAGGSGLGKGFDAGLGQQHLAAAIGQAACLARHRRGGVRQGFSPAARVGRGAGNESADGGRISQNSAETQNRGRLKSGVVQHADIPSS